MQLIDRLLVIVAGLLLIAVVTVIVLVPETIITALVGLADINLLLRVALVVIVNILILVALFLRLRSRRGPTKGLEVKAPGAFTDISIESAQALILNAVNNVPDVASADATVKAVDGRADVDLNVQVAGKDVHIPQKQKEINRALKQVINKQLGLKMRGQPRVHISLQPEAPVTVSQQQGLPSIVAPVPQPQVKVEETRDSDTLVLDAKPENSAQAQAEKAEVEDEPEVETPAETTDDWLNSYREEKRSDTKND